MFILKSRTTKKPTLTPRYENVCKKKIMHKHQPPRRTILSKYITYFVSSCDVRVIKLRGPVPSTVIPSGRHSRRPRAIVVAVAYSVTNPFVKRFAHLSPVVRRRFLSRLIVFEFFFFFRYYYFTRRTKTTTDLRRKKTKTCVETITCARMEKKKRREHSGRARFFSLSDATRAYPLDKNDDATRL